MLAFILSSNQKQENEAWLVYTGRWAPREQITCCVYKTFLIYPSFNLLIFQLLSGQILYAWRSFHQLLKMVKLYHKSSMDQMATSPPINKGYSEVRSSIRYGCISCNCTSKGGKKRVTDHFSMGLTKKQHHTCRSFCFMYSHILFTAPARDNEFSPVPKNFTRASESGRQARSPELPFFCRFPLLFGSSESERWRVKTILLSQDCKCTDFFINILTWVGCSSTQLLQNSVIYTKETSWPIEFIPHRLELSHLLLLLLLLLLFCTASLFVKSHPELLKCRKPFIQPSN